MSIRSDIPLDVIQVEYEPTLHVSFDLVGPSAAQPYRLYPNINGPATTTVYGADLVQGVLFVVTQSGLNLDGYFFWCAPTGQLTSPVHFALWQSTALNTGTLISAGTVTSGNLNAGTWTYKALPAPVPLTVNQPYKAQVGSHGNFPETDSWWTTSGSGWDGVTNGPLTAYSAPTGSNPSPFNDAQNTFDVSGPDPTAVYAATANKDYNCWLDIQVSGA